MHTKKECKVEGCDTAVEKIGLCGKHGAYGTCKFDGCTTNARAGFEHCTIHGGGKKKKPCAVWDALLDLSARAAVANTAAVQSNAGTQAAPT